MSSVVIAGNTSGTVTLDAPDIAGSTVLTLPATSGTVLTTTGGVAPGTSGNVLTSDGTTWTSATPATSVTSLNGETGAITNTDLYAIGSYVNGRPANGTSYVVNNTVAGSSLYSTTVRSPSYRTDTGWYSLAGQTLVNVGTWRCVSPASGDGNLNNFSGLWVRIS